MGIERRERERERRDEMTVQKKQSVENSRAGSPGKRREIEKRKRDEGTERERERSMDPDGPGIFP